MNSKHFKILAGILAAAMFLMLVSAVSASISSESPVEVLKRIAGSF